MCWPISVQLHEDALPCSFRTGAGKGLDSVCFRFCRIWFYTFCLAPAHTYQDSGLSGDPALPSRAAIDPRLTDSRLCLDWEKTHRKRKGRENMSPRLQICLPSLSVLQSFASDFFVCMGTRPIKVLRLWLRKVFIFFFGHAHEQGRWGQKMCYQMLFDIPQINNRLQRGKVTKQRAGIFWK